MRLSIVIPTWDRAPTLARALDRLERQRVPATSFEVVVVADSRESDLESVRLTLEGRPFATRVLAAERPGASAARNVGWRAAQAPLVLFMGDDILADSTFLSGHLDWHERHPEPTVGVLGDLRWADEIRVTPFMRWLEGGVQFDYRQIEGEEAGWGRLYTANVSLKRSMLERVDGFDEERLPFLYEDLDLGRRLHELGFRLLFNRAASGEHLHTVTPESWSRRAADVATAEHMFVRLHPDVPPYFFDFFGRALRGPRARGRGVALARFVPPSVPVLGPKVWSSVDAFYRQQLAEPFFEAWHEAEEREAAEVAS